MGERAFQGVLNEVVGCLAVAAQANRRKPGICASIRAARSGITSPFERRLPGSHHNARTTGGKVLLPATIPIGLPAIILAVLLTV
jgi:hypothetical protein